jgi:hypothetical protein
MVIAETKREALENGGEVLLTKPVDFGTLRSEIDMRVGRAEGPIRIEVGRPYGPGSAQS